VRGSSRRANPIRHRGPVNPPTPFKTRLPFVGHLIRELVKKADVRVFRWYQRRHIIFTGDKSGLSPLTSLLRADYAPLGEWAGFRCREGSLPQTAFAEMTVTLPRIGTYDL